MPTGDNKRKERTENSTANQMNFHSYAREKPLAKPKMEVITFIDRRPKGLL